MIWFRACPRCHGDLREVVDQWGRTVLCLQCGYELTPAQEARLRLETVARKGQGTHRDLVATGR
ncbi:MAG: hypothetical protein NZ951_03500 [Dehalococcoidia bacterium]|nr:hypothetical protein [Dehalococcoidia bacterium]MDW8119353.1 hypothetical protein [Chloroflexota bacterium]